MKRRRKRYRLPPMGNDARNTQTDSPPPRFAQIPVSPTPPKKRNREMLDCQRLKVCSPHASSRNGLLSSYQGDFFVGKLIRKLLRCAKNAPNFLPLRFTIASDLPFAHTAEERGNKKRPRRNFGGTYLAAEHLHRRNCVGLSKRCRKRA